MYIAWDGMIFDVVLLHDWAKEAEMTEDGSTFLCWHHVIEADIILNVDATSAAKFPLEQFSREGQADEIVRAFGGPNLPAQQRAIKQFLAAPNVVRNPAPNGGGFGPRRDGVLEQLERDEAAFAAGFVAGGAGPVAAQTIPVKPNVVAGGQAGPGTFNRLIFGEGFGGNIPKPAQAVILPQKVDIKSLGLGPEISNTRPTIPYTDIELRRRLARPRRQLLVWIHSGPDGDPEFILVSPHQGCGIDARHGPTCTVLDTVEVHGVQTAVVRVKFETWQLEPPIASLAQITTTNSIRSWAANKKDFRRAEAAKKLVIHTPALTSHRWLMKTTWNPETHLREIHREGLATFRLDVLKLRKLGADQLRQQIWHPIPKGYVREPPEIELSEGGDGIHYVCVDREVYTHNLGGAEHGVIHLEVEQDFSYKGRDFNFEAK